MRFPMVLSTFCAVAMLCTHAKANPVYELQKFKWGKNGRIYLVSNEKLCLTIAQGKSRQGGGGSPKHLIRNLLLELCDNAEIPSQMWSVRSMP